MESEGGRSHDYVQDLVYCFRSLTHNNSSIFLIIDESVVKPYKLLVLSHHCKVRLLEHFQRRLEQTHTQSKLCHSNHITRVLHICTLVCTVNLTLSCSLRASDISTTSDVSNSRSTVPERGLGLGSSPLL